MANKLISRLKNRAVTTAGIVGLGLASILAPQTADAAITTNVIYNHTNVVKDANFVAPSTDRAVYYTCNDVRFNNRETDKGIVALYVKKLSPTNNATQVVGGLTVMSNSFSTEMGHFNSLIGTIGMASGETPTNGLNGGSYRIVLKDENQNGKVGEYIRDSANGNWTITAEPGEFVGTNNANIVITGMPAFPSGGTGPVSIASVRVNGYKDEDHDQIPDYFEAKYSPTVPPLQNTFTQYGDYDQDGVTDLEEWIAGTNPTNRDTFATGYTTGTNGNPQIVWNSLPGRLYDVNASTKLVSPSWFGATDATNLPGTGSNMTWTLALATNPASFYKVDVKLSPDEVVNPP